MLHSNTACLLLTVSVDLLPPYVQSVSDGSATMGEGRSFTDSPIWVCVNAMHYFHWLSGPPCRKRIAIRHNTVLGGDVSIATHPISHCRTTLPASVSGPFAVVDNTKQCSLCIRGWEDLTSIRTGNQYVPVLELFSTLASTCIYIVTDILFYNAANDKGKFVT